RQDSDSGPLCSSKLWGVAHGDHAKFMPAMDAYQGTSAASVRVRRGFTSVLTDHGKSVRQHQFWRLCLQSLHVALQCMSLLRCCGHRSFPAAIEGRSGPNILTMSCSQNDQ